MFFSLYYDIIYGKYTIQLIVYVDICITGEDYETKKNRP